VDGLKADFQLVLIAQASIELLAARYPVIRRLVGELSFRVAARFYLLWKIIPRHSRFKRASAGGGTLP